MPAWAEQKILNSKPRLLRNQNELPRLEDTYPKTANPQHSLTWNRDARPRLEEIEVAQYSAVAGLLLPSRRKETLKMLKAQLPQ